MGKFRFIRKGLIVILLLLPALAAAQAPVSGDLIQTVREVQQYNFAIHILAMLLVGFGFGFILRATGAKEKAYKDYEEFAAIPEP